MKYISRKEALKTGKNTYFTGNPCKHNHISERNTKTCVCVECHKNHVIKWRENNRDIHNGYQTKYRQGKTGRAKVLLSNAKNRAKKRQLDFDLTLKYLEDRMPDQCPVLKLRIDYSGKNKECCPSIDRIDNNKGYTKDNIRIISMRANAIKRDASVEEIAQILNYMRKRSK